MLTTGNCFYFKQKKKQKKLGKYYFFKSINNWFNINILFKCDNFKNYSTFYLIYLFINKSKKISQ